MKSQLSEFWNLCIKIRLGNIRNMCDMSSSSISVDLALDFFLYIFMYLNQATLSTLFFFFYFKNIFVYFFIVLYFVVSTVAKPERSHLCNRL